LGKWQDFILAQSQINAGVDVLDSPNPTAIEAALKIAGGKCLINPGCDLLITLRFNSKSIYVRY